MIYSIASNVNDKSIVLCNEASERKYVFGEEGSVEMSAWESCFEIAFGKGLINPPRSGKGNIANAVTCVKLKGFKDDCLWLVAMTNNDKSVCRSMSTAKKAEMCVRDLNKTR